MQPGSHLGPYEVLSRIGAGGMGEVWRARDTRLARDVAIKVLPEEFARDGKLKIRFEREARAIAHLAHPNICTLFDVGENYLVMELLDGETLGERLTRGPLTLVEVIRYGAQLAEALGQAHKQSVVHRDVKPGNVMITKAGAKLLDFGLAKSTRVDAASYDETVQKPVTEQGAVVGTLQYMAPEQLAGEEPDARTDVFALGAVLYEMATGKRAFEGKTRTSLVSAIVSREPRAMRELQPLTPPSLEHVVLRCLEKERDERWQSASDIAHELRWIGQAESQGGAAIRPHEPPPPVSLRVTVRQVTDDAGVETMPAISPDGKFVAYVSARAGRDDIYLQRIGGTNALNLTASSPANDSQPAFSRDGHWIAFRSDRDGGGIFTMGAMGESLRRVCDFGSHPSWSPDGRELVVSSAVFSDPGQRQAATGELWIIDVNSGRRRQLTTLATDGDAAQPSWSPHGARIAFWGWSVQRDRIARYLATIPPQGGKPVRIVEGEHNLMNPVWSPDGRYLYFSSDRGGTVNLWRMAVVESSGEKSGDPEPVTLPARTAWPVSVAADGRTIAYCARDSRWTVELVRLSADGTHLDGRSSVFGRTTEIRMQEVSPDGQWMTYTSDNHVYLASVDGSQTLQLTHEPGRETYPSWAPDGKRITFHSDRGGKAEIWSIGADGSGLTQITSETTSVIYPRWSPDGSRITTRADEASRSGTAIVDMRGSFPVSARDETLPAYDAPGYLCTHDWSPDGKWLVGVFWRDEHHPTQMLIYSFETKTYTKLLDPNPLWPGFARWMPDSRHVLYSDGRRILTIDRVTAQTHEVVDLGSPFDGFLTVTRDGRSVYYVRHAEESDVWVATLE